MATHQAIGSVAEAVARLLQQSWRPALAPGVTPSFSVYQGKDFSSPMTAGISVFVYQVTVDQVQRTLPPSRADRRRPVPLVVKLLLSAWAKDVSMEHYLLGWAIRAVNDNPILSAGFLNAAVADVFRPDETIELFQDELTNDEVFHLWQVLPSSLQLSVCFQARVLRVESELAEPQGTPVAVRELQMARKERP